MAKNALSLMVLEIFWVKVDQKKKRRLNAMFLSTGRQKQKWHQVKALNE